MSNPLSNLNVKHIHDLLELVSPAMAHEIAVDDSEGVLKPKRLSLTNLAKLFVPYNGAVNDVDLGAHDITALRGLFDSLHLNTDPTSIPSDDDIGAMYYDTNALTYTVVLPNGVRAQIGEELFVLVTRYASAPNPILNGTPVYTVGESGQRPTVDVARADTLSKIKVTGIATHDIANQGRITSFGLVRAIPLARKPAGETWVAGNYLWLAPTGGMTNVEPSRPTPNVRLGLITNVTGSASFDMLVYIRPAMGMYDLYDVNGDAPDNHSVLEYDSVVGYFKKTNEPVFVKVTVGALISAFQKLASHTIPGSDDDILRLQNQQVGKPHSILEIRSPDTATTEATLSLHNVASGTNDWVFDLSMHNYSGVMKLVSVLSHFTGTDAGSWEWWSRYTTGTDYDMIERQLMKLDGQTGYLGIGEALSPEARVHVKQSGWVDKPAMMIVMDSSHDSYPEGLYVKNDTNFASGGNLIRFKLVNVTDTATLLKLENAGTGNYINADGKFVVDKDGNIESPTIEALKGVGYTEGTLKTHEDRLDTLEGADTTEGSVAKTVKDAVEPIETRLDSTELTLARQGQDLASVKQTLQQGNGATLDFSDIGQVALDARATGRANPTVVGRTLSNLATWGELLSTAGWNIGSSITGFSIVDQVMTFTGGGDPAGSSVYWLYNSTIHSSLSLGDKVAIILRAKADDTSTRLYAGFAYNSLPNSLLSTEYQTLAFIATIGGVGYSNQLRQVRFASSGGSKKVYIDASAGNGIRLINLTNSGMESVTEEQLVSISQSYFDGTKSIQLPARLRSVGKNLFDGEMELGTLGSVGETVASTTINRSKNFIPILPLSSITTSFSGGSIAGIWFYDKNYTFVGNSPDIGGTSPKTFTNPFSTAVYAKFRSASGSSALITGNIQLELGSTATPYEPYTDSTLYIADNEELRSVPAIADEVKVVNGQLVKVQNVQNITSAMTPVYSQDAWATTGGWLSTFGTLSIFDGTLRNTAPVEGGSIITRREIAGCAGKLFILRVRRSSDGNLVIRANSNTTTLGVFSLTANVWATIAVVFPSPLQTNSHYFIAEEMESSGTFDIDWIWIGGTSYISGTGTAQDLGSTFSAINANAQLATPIITPLTTSGILQAKQKGTVYYEPYYEGSHQTNASSQITLPYTGTIDKLTGYDENLEPYEVPSTGYTLVGTTLTVTGAVENEVFYVELSRSEPLAPEMSVNVINNAEVAEDSVTGKFYKKTFTVANGIPTFGIEEVL